MAGASCDRSVDAPLAGALAKHFTVLNYDRRGRGDSGDTLPFAVQREVEDLDVMLAAAGGSATVVGLSSGAALAAEAAASGLRIDALVLWEPPLSVDEDGVHAARIYADELAEMLAAGRRGDALQRFMRRVGLREEMIAGIRQSPYWDLGERIAPTLAYDAAVLGDTRVPIERYTRIEVATLVLAGADSPDFLRAAAAEVAAAIPDARHDVLDGQDHNVAGDVLAPVVAQFREGVHRVITGMALVCVNVLDMDVAREFYVDTLGFDVSYDAVHDGFHFFIIHSPKQPEVPLMLVVPGPPAVDEETAAQIRSLIATGHMAPGAMATDDCWATYRELQAKGVEFIEPPEDRFYGIDAAFRDPFGNHWRLTQPRPMERPTG